jgi:hypothetical protein
MRAPETKDGRQKTVGGRQVQSPKIKDQRSKTVYVVDIFSARLGY